jgi:hypothetical protein
MGPVKVRCYAAFPVRLIIIIICFFFQLIIMMFYLGMHWHIYEQISVMGKAAFYDQTLMRNMTYLGSEWRNNALVKNDVEVDRMLRGAVGFSDEKMAMLADLLNLELGGRMHLLSDGQRQGVQIGCALMKEFKGIEKCFLMFFLSFSWRFD